MKAIVSILTVIAAATFLVACGRDHDHDAGEEQQSHGDDAQSFSGATHKEGQGITLLPETKERLGIQMAEVHEAVLPHEIVFRARIFETKPGGLFRASGFVRTDQAKDLKPGLPVSIRVRDGTTSLGTIENSASLISTNEAELILRFESTNSALRVGSFLHAIASVPTDEPVPTIPKEALIKGTTESFVYVQNGESYLRTVVTPGRSSNDTIEIKDGLLEGDAVVAKGAMDLWLVELRAVKGGQGCCPAPPAKGKGK